MGKLSEQQTHDLRGYAADQRSRTWYVCGFHVDLDDVLDTVDDLRAQLSASQRAHEETRAREQRRLDAALWLINEGWIDGCHEDESCPEDDTCDCVANYHVSVLVNEADAMPEPAELERREKLFADKLRALDGGAKADAKGKDE